MGKATMAPTQPDVRATTDRRHEGADLDLVRRRLALMEEFLAWRRLVERSQDEPASPEGEAEATSTPAPARGHAPELEWMRRAQRALVTHPVATQSAFVALAREGRAFAKTDDGRAWTRVLEGAPAVQRLRTLWEAANFTLSADEQDATLPSAMIELFVRSAASGDVDDLAERLGMPFIEPDADARKGGAD